MDLRRKTNGKWELRWREGARKRARTFDRKGDAVAFEADRMRRKQLGRAAIPDDQPLADFVETYWRLHAVPNLANSTRDFYKLTWVNHIMPRLGDYGVRELTPKRLARFREDLEKAGVGAATVRKAMAILRSCSRSSASRSRRSSSSSTLPPQSASRGMSALASRTSSFPQRSRTSARG